MSAELYALPSSGLAHTPEQLAAELHAIADDIASGVLNPVRIALVFEDRDTRAMTTGAIGDRTDYAQLFWMFHKVMHAVFSAKPTDLYPSGDAA